MKFLPTSLSLTVACLSGLAYAEQPTKEDGLKFIEEKQKEEGVVTLPSGLAYKVLKKGEGKFHPTIDSPCSCHYSGALINGDKFDSSYDRGEPTTFAPNQVIKGWTEAMQLMVEGDKWEMYIPSELAYGERGSPPKIPGGSTLVFQMEILKITGDSVKAVHCNVETLEECSKKEKTYIEKQKQKVLEGALNLVDELERLQKMHEQNAKTRNLTKKQRKWLDDRIKICGNMVQKGLHKKEGLTKEEL